MEALFYAGIAAMAAAVLTGVCAALVFRRRAVKLKRMLDEEYGARKKKP